MYIMIKFSVYWFSSYHAMIEVWPEDDLQTPYPSDADG